MPDIPRTPQPPRAPARSPPPSGARYARIVGVGGYRPERVVMNSELVDAIDSSDEWIRERSGIVSRRFAAEDETVVDMAEARRAPGPRARRDHARPARLRPHRDGHPPLPDPRRRTRARGPPRLDRSGVGHLGRLRRLLLRRRARQRHGQAAARPTTSSSSASRSSPTSPTATTAARPSSSATAPAPPSSAPPIRPASARPSGAPTAPSATPSRNATRGSRSSAPGGRRRSPTAGRSTAKAGRPSTMAGPERLPLGRLGHGARRAAGDRHAPASTSTTSTPSSPTRPTCGSSTR